MDLTIYIVLSVLFFLIALLYSSAGFGGGSSYLAILALFSLGFATVRTTALVCNLVVVSGSLLAVLSARKFSYQLFLKMLPFTLVSVPFAFWAGSYKITEYKFFMFLGITLVATSLIMLIVKPVEEVAKRPQKIGAKKAIIKQMGVGGALGSIAGMVGIGGGIFLSPYLHLSRWETAKNISITTTFFILVNSIAGLFGQIFNQSLVIDFKITGLLAIAVFLGGSIGVRLNIKSLSNKKIRKVTAIVILMAGLNVLRKYVVL